MNNWIEINVLLPDEHKDVLFGYYYHDTFYTHIGHLMCSENTIIFLDPECGMFYEVTHWMHLPKPPEKNK